MGRADFLKLGDWNSICDECGQKWKATKLKKTWEGLMKCPHCWEIRNPQDFVKGVKDDQTTPFTRPESPDVFI